MDPCDVNDHREYATPFLRKRKEAKCPKCGCTENKVKADEKTDVYFMCKMCNFTMWLI